MAVSDFDELEKIGENDDEVESILEILSLYSERHMSRARRYLKKSFYIDYVLDQTNRPGY